MPHHTLPTHSLSNIRLIAFDADDTLWDNQSHFENAEQIYCRLLSPYGTAEEVSEALFNLETHNMPLLGYGCKAFTISLVENAIRFTQGRISANDILKIVELGKELLSLPASPLTGVETALQKVKDMGKHKLVVFTKGEIQDQENKLERSALTSYFDDIVVVADKNCAEYLRLCKHFDIDIDQLLMIGNSFKSDIEPVLRLGGYAVHIPFHTTWQHEQVEEYEHPHLQSIENMSELPACLQHS